MPTETPPPKQLKVREHLLGYTEHTLQGLKHVQKALTQETVESKTMVESYAKFLANKATPTEIEHANKQFQNLLKTLGLGTLFILPGGVVTLPLTILAAKKLGIDLVPDAFKSHGLPTATPSTPTLPTSPQHTGNDPEKKSEP